MPTNREEVLEEKLRMLIEEWPESSMDDLAERLEVSEETIEEWVRELKRTMKAQCMTEEMIEQALPPKKKTERADVFEKVVNELFATCK